MSDFQLQRLGMLMEPEPGNPQEVEGALNPVAVRGTDGKLYLFPRLVVEGNYSRIGIALEPEADYERLPGGGARCEDARVTYVEPLRRYGMAYAALSSVGPRSHLRCLRVSFAGSGSGWRSLKPIEASISSG